VEETLMGMLEQNNRAPTAQLAPQDGQIDDYGDGDWLKRAQDAYRDSTSYVDNNFRKSWDDSIRAFNNQHSADSKYNMAAYDKRSKLYRPKTRSIIRKNEAAAAAAFFSNMETTNVTPVDASNKVEAASAQIMKELLQYRLTKSIPWYQIVLGGLQDAQVTGVACAHVHWEYEADDSKEEEEESGKLTLGGAEMSNEYPAQSEGMLPEGAEVVMPDEVKSVAAHEAENEQETPWQVALSAGGDPLEPPSVDEYKDFGPEMPEVVKATAKNPPKGAKPKLDKPTIDLIPVENIRIDPGANWIDPINSSPYVIHLIPMYVMDIREKMEDKVWRKLGDELIRAAADTKQDSTRAARGKDRDDPYTPDGKSLPDYEVVWVQRHIHRRKGMDWEFYTLGDTALLTAPRLLIETVFHGLRPYVMGNCILEAHRIMPSSLPQLGKGLQDEANEVANQRIDNVKFVLNKKWFVKRGRDVDIAGLMRNVPGGAVMMEDPINDVREISWPDVTGSAFEEQGRIDNDLNDLLGNFSAGQVMADKGIQGPARNMAILQQGTGTLVEYLLRTYVETFVQPILRQMVLLEQKYETDQNILAIVAKKAKLFQKFGLDQITDEILEKELTLTVNVGMGATDPNMKLQKFLLGMKTYIDMTKEPAPGLNLQEVGREIFGHMGYSDGTRFFTNDDPNIAKMQDLLQKQAKVIADLTQKVNEKMTGFQVKKEATKIMSETRLKETALREEGANMRASVTHLRAIREQDKAQAHEVVTMGIKRQHEMDKMSHQHTMDQAIKVGSEASAAPSIDAAPQPEQEAA
jgi:hypothetical protein